MDDDFFFYNHVDVAKRLSNQKIINLDPGNDTVMLGQSGIYKNEFGRYLLDVAINNPNGPKLRMIWDSGGDVTLVTGDSAKAMGIQIPKNAQVENTQGFGGETASFQGVPVTLYMPRAAPVKTTIYVMPNSSGNSLINNNDILAAYNLYVTPEGVQFTPK